MNAFQKASQAAATPAKTADSLPEKCQVVNAEDYIERGRLPACEKFPNGRPYIAFDEEGLVKAAYTYRTAKESAVQTVGINMKFEQPLWTMNTVTAFQLEDASGVIKQPVQVINYRGTVGARVAKSSLYIGFPPIGRHDVVDADIRNDYLCDYGLYGKAAFKAAEEQQAATLGVVEGAGEDVDEETGIAGV